jgi:hypothetical protein
MPHCPAALEKLQQVQAHAEQLIAAHLEPKDWRFRFSHGIKQLGACRFSSAKSGQISLSKHHAITGDWAEITDTILHEIAHALAGPRQGHKALWKAHCLRIGAKPIARAPVSVIKTPFKYYLVYPAEKRILSRSNRLCKWVKRPQDYWLKNQPHTQGQLRVIAHAQAENEGYFIQETPKGT